MNEVDEVIVKYNKYIIHLGKEKSELERVYKNVLCFLAFSALMNAVLLFMWLWELNR
jgi:hypothetical protein